MGGKLAAIAVAGRSVIGRFALADGVGLFLRSIQNTLGDFDVFARQVMLLRAQLFGFGAEFVAPEFADNHLEPAQARPDDRRAQSASAPEAPSVWHSLRTGRRCSCPASITVRPPPPSVRTGTESFRRIQPASCGERRCSGRTSRQSSPSSEGMQEYPCW